MGDDAALDVRGTRCDARRRYRRYPYPPRELYLKKAPNLSKGHRQQQCSIASREKAAKAAGVRRTEIDSTARLLSASCTDQSLDPLFDVTHASCQA
jgi:hypothetical protein